MKRRPFVATAAGVGTALLAGCTGDDNGTAGDETGRGVFRLLVSDQPAAIEDFDSLDVTLSSGRIFRAGDDEEVTPAVVTGTGNEPEDDEAAQEGFVELDLDNVTVDLTQVTGDRAVAVVEDELEAGRYSGIELRVATAKGVVDGEAVEVKVPSDRLRIVKPFEMGADEELSFVFDIRVIQKGPVRGYSLLPVIGKSGVAGEEVEIEEVEPGGNVTA